MNAEDWTPTQMAIYVALEINGPCTEGALVGLLRVEDTAAFRAELRDMEARGRVADVGSGYRIINKDDPGVEAVPHVELLSEIARFEAFWKGERGAELRELMRRFNVTKAAIRYRLAVLTQHHLVYRDDEQGTWSTYRLTPLARSFVTDPNDYEQSVKPGLVTHFMRYTRFIDLAFRVALQEISNDVAQQQLKLLIEGAAGSRRFIEIQLGITEAGSPNALEKDR